jgi:4a-hydroxytetrahydrobiopterin dehydratase
MKKPIARTLIDLSGPKPMPALWRVRDDGLALLRRFEFENFVQAFGFMTRMAMFSERIDHHPEWSNVYRVVDVCLTTHDAAGVTALDLAWAEQANLEAGP